MLLAGCVLDRPPGPKYCAKLRFAELDLRDPLPRAGTMYKWREQLPDGFELALRVPQAALVSATGPLRPSPDREPAMRWTHDAANALAASWVVFATPATFTPGGRSRELLRAFVGELPQIAGRRWVWSYSGAWEAEDAAELADELGLVCAFDPLESDRPTGADAYARLRAIGHRRSFSEASLQDALEKVAPTLTVRGAICVESERAFQHATRLQALLQDSLPDE